jgi:hypothetical protein
MGMLILESNSSEHVPGKYRDFHETKPNETKRHDNIRKELLDTLMIPNDPKQQHLTLLA